MGRDRAPARQELGGHGALEPEEILDLPREDDQGDTAREADGHGVGDELDRTAQPREAEAHQDDARHEGRHREPFHPVALDDCVDDHDEGARRPADLHARAPQRRDDESRDDRGEQPALGTDPARDREGDGERECDDTDDDPGDQIREELLAGVPRDRGDELRDQPVQIPRLPMTPVAPSNPGPPNATNDFCAPWARNTAPSTSRSARTPRSNIGHLQNEYYLEIEILDIESPSEQLSRPGGSWVK